MRSPKVFLPLFLLTIALGVAASWALGGRTAAPPRHAVDSEGHKSARARRPDMGGLVGRQAEEAKDVLEGLAAVTRWMRAVARLKEAGTVGELQPGESAWAAAEDLVLKPDGSAWVRSAAPAVPRARLDTVKAVLLFREDDDEALHVIFARGPGRAAPVARLRDLVAVESAATAGGELLPVQFADQPPDTEGTTGPGVVEHGDKKLRVRR